MSTIPKLDLKAIKARIDERSYERGEAYFRNGSIFDTRRQGATLKARCEGSQGGPYRVEVTFDGKEITDAECSCPVGDGGFCKHVAALLLTWRARPEQFDEVEEIEAALERRSKPELIALIKQMLRREPDLERLLEAPAPGRRGKGKPADPDAYRRRARAAIRSIGYDDWGYGGPDVGEFAEILESGDTFLEQGDYAAASAVYEGLADAMIEGADTIQDEEGEVSQIVADCVNGLAKCLAGLEGDPARREAILKVLVDADDYFGSYGGEPEEDIAEFIAANANAEERRTVAGWLRARMPAKGGGWSDDYRRREYARFLIALEGEALADDAYLKICRDSGLGAELVGRLLERERLDEAAAELDRAADHEFLSLADVFVSHRQSEAAETHVRARAEAKKNVAAWEWLKRRHASRRDKAGVRALAETVYRLNPTFEGYKELRTLTPKKEWETVRTGLRERLAKSGYGHDLIRAYLDEGDIDLAIAAVKAERGYGSGMALEVAKAAEKSRTPEAIAIYRKQAESEIDARSRDHYREACQFLRKVRDLYKQLGEPDEWAYYVGVLRERHRSLPAFQDELTKAKL
jgi:uncharacterized Zn finger protein